MQQEDASRVKPIFFKAKQPVRWLAPNRMVEGAYGEYFGGLFSKYTDNRHRIDMRREAVFHCSEERLAEAEADGKADPLDLEVADDEPLIIDYVADVGDGFGATYAVADALARPSIPVTDPPLPRGELLIFGGDQVYPVANPIEYRDRTIGPYSIAFSRTVTEVDVGEPGPPNDRPTFAIPGNHDWYDGLMSFLDLFTLPKRREQPAAAPTDEDDQPDEGDADDELDEAPYNDVPWGRRQTRSYFAAELRQGWWLWGVDVGLGGTGRISEGQLDYFREAERLLAPDDKLILCTAEPAWIKRGPTGFDREPDAWDELVDFLVEVLGPERWTTRVEMILSGDKHYYARHQLDDAEVTSVRPVLVTAGGGGAYLSSTLDAHDRVELNHRPVEKRKGLATHTCRARWPNKADSRWMGFWGLVRIPLTNPMLNSLFSVLYGLFAYFSLAGWREPAFARASPLNRTLGRLANGSPLEAIHTAAVGSIVTLSGLLFVLFLFGVLGAYSWAAGRGQNRTVVAVFIAIHAVLQAIGLVVTLILAAKLSLGGDSAPFEVKWFRVLVLWTVALVVMALPILWNRFWYRVNEYQRLWLFAPSVVVLASLIVIGVSSAETGALTVVVAAMLIGGAVGPLVFSLNLVLGQYRGLGLNELFVGIRRTGYKHFLRIELYAAGPVVNVIGLRRTIPRSASFDREHGNTTMTSKRSISSHDRQLAPSPPELVDRFGSAAALDQAGIALADRYPATVSSERRRRQGPTTVGS